MKDWIKQVAQATGKTPQTVRLAIQQGWEIGVAVKLAGSNRYEYLPHPQKIKELIGIDIGDDDEEETDRTCYGNCSHDRNGKCQRRTSNFDETDRDIRDHRVLLP